MKHSGRAHQAALKLVLWTLLGLMAVFAGGLVAMVLAAVIKWLSVALIVLWVLFSAFTFYFFRDPDANVPTGPNLVVSPAHGKVDAIDQTTEPHYMGGSCQRISMFLSLIDIHVQNAPVTGKISFYRYSTGKFMSAMKSESAQHNENLLLGIEAERGVKIGLRVIAGLLARRIVPYVNEGDEILRGERISLVQFGSRADLYLPLSAKVKIKLGDHVVGGETVMATLE